MNPVNPERLSVEFHSAPYGLAMSVSGDLDAGTAGAFRRQADGLSMGDGPLYVLLDLTGLSFCDSSGLSALIGLWRRVMETSGLLALTGAHGVAARILHTTAMHQVFRLYPSQEEAIAALTSAQPPTPA
ncbi:STAS domain-containing protein [Streptosporangiaceae bacterium NEAU-GS5]|nr:STAS domain-containing protein [Streptosporangiaceae bacterium NEAU-GS5]